VAARAVLLAPGVAWRRLGVPSLEALAGAGVFDGAARSEAHATRGQQVYVVGGGNSAGQAAVHLAEHAATVTMLVRGDTLGTTMSDYLSRKIQAAPNIVVRLRSEVVDGHGGGHLEGLTLRDRDRAPPRRSRRRPCSCSSAPSRAPAGSGGPSPAGRRYGRRPGASAVQLMHEYLAEPGR
jgi:thioredoxin reductase (NADPH)